MKNYYSLRWVKISTRLEYWIYSKILNLFLIRFCLYSIVQVKRSQSYAISSFCMCTFVSLFYWNQEPETTSQSPKSQQLHISGPYMHAYDTLLNSSKCICSRFDPNCSTTFVNFYFLNLDLTARITWSLSAIVYYNIIQWGNGPRTRSLLCCIKPIKWINFKEWKKFSFTLGQIHKLFCLVDPLPCFLFWVDPCLRK